MPFEIEEDADESESIESMLEKYIRYADKKLAEQLGEIASVEALIEWR